MGLLEDIGRTLDWASDFTSETVEEFKASAPALKKFGEETIDFVGYSAKALAKVGLDTITDVTESAAVWIADALREEPRNPSAFERSQEAAKVPAHTSKAPMACVKGGCLNPRASDQFMCWEHLYEARAYELAALRAREQLQEQENQRLATLCEWKACIGKRVEDELYCAHHKRENEQLKARRCGQKYRYPSVEDARTEAHRMQGIDLAAFNVYMCNFCHHYHIGHARPS